MLQNAPQVVKNLIIINVLFFVASMLMGQDQAVTLARRYLPRLALFSTMADHHAHVYAWGTGSSLLQHVCFVHVWEPVGEIVGPEALFELLHHQWLGRIFLA